MDIYPKAIAFPKVGDLVPEVIFPMHLPFEDLIKYPFLAIPLSIISIPTNFLFMPDSFCFLRFLWFINYLLNLVIHPNPASIGEVSSLISLPYRQNPFSNLKVSLAARPIGLILTDVWLIAFHSWRTFLFLT